MHAGPSGSRQVICCLCEAMCGLDLQLDQGRITDLCGNPRDVFSRGHLCPKAMALQDLHLDPDRLRRPQIRQGLAWHESAWEPAFALARERLLAIRRRWGPDAIGLYVGNPAAHHFGPLLALPTLAKSLGSRNRFSSSSLDQLPLMLASLQMFGHQLLMPVPDIPRTDFLLMLGANPLVSNGSALSAPGLRGLLRELRDRGGRSILLDPRRSESAAHVSEHHFIRPGSDAALLLALLHALNADQALRAGRLGAVTNGLEQLPELLAPYSPEAVSAFTGLAPERIRHLARRFGAAPRAVCYGRMGTSTQAFGGLATWLIQVLNLATGRLDTPGGAMFASPAADLVALAAALGETGSFGRWHSRVRGLPEFSGELPSATLGDEIESDGPGQIKALIVYAGNPVLSAPNGPRLEGLLPGLEFMLSIDLYRNETSRFADLILPGLSPLEQPHYDLLYNLLALRNTARYAPALHAPPAEAWSDARILLRLAQDLASGWNLQAKAQAASMQALGCERVLDAMLRTGPYGLGRAGLSLARLRRAADGLDFGPLQPVLPGRLYTPDKRIRLLPDCYLQDLPRLQQAMAEARAVRLNDSKPGFAPLCLIGRRQLRSNNSWLHNSERMVRGRPQCTLLMHPDDAIARGLLDGETVLLRSRTGNIRVPLALSRDLMPGVVSLPHGWGHHRPGTALRVAAAHAGLSANDVSDERFLDALTGTAAFNGLPVEVLADAAPAMT